MRIDKAIKREKKGQKIFYLTMISLFCLLPVILYLSGIKNLFLYLFLLGIEFLIIISTIGKINFWYLKQKGVNNKLTFKSGIFSKESLILCDKICIVDTDKVGEDMWIIIVTNMKFKNRLLKPITKGFLNKYPEISKEYHRILKINDTALYYYQIVKRGGMKKYTLLDYIYKNSARATYTDSAIENIKIARGQNEI